jgi:hypothetical protein
LVREAISTALDGITVLQNQAREVAGRFRRDGEAGAQLDFAHLIQNSHTLLRLAAVVAEACGTSIEALEEAHGLSAERRTRAAVTELIHQQLVQNWFAVAATLERELVAALQEWRRILAALSGWSPDPGPHGHAA